jgi:hypothetical protein
VTRVLGALLLALLCSEEEEPPRHRITPIQGDLSVAFGPATDDRSLTAGALYVGGALGWANDGKPSLFGGFGFEVTYTAAADPYRMSMGGQLRVGLAWAKHRGFTSDVSPDLLVYLRVTPFGGGLVATGTTPAGTPTSVSRVMFGVRAGVGLTALWGARLFFDHFPFFDVGGFGGDLLKVLSALLLFPIAMLNHAEVALEYAMSPQPLLGLMIRLGAGF